MNIISANVWFRGFTPFSLLAVAILFSPDPALARQDAGLPPVADEPSKELPLPGEVFRVEGHTAFLILPEGAKVAEGMPWVWYAPTLPRLPGPEERWMFERFLKAGIAVGGIDVGESFGSPEGRASSGSSWT